MWNSTKIKREKQRQDDEQRRLDKMVAKVGMPPNWPPVGRDKKGWVYRWRNGVSYVEHRSGSWYWYMGIKTKHFTENGAFACPVAVNTANRIRNLTPNQYDLLQYFGSIAHVAVAEAKMEGLGWTWVRQGNYRANHEVPSQRRRRAAVGAATSAANSRNWRSEPMRFAPLGRTNQSSP